MLAQPRLILLHKQSTSARVRFLCLADGVVGPAPLPEGATLHDPDFASTVQCHPTAPLQAAERQLGLSGGAIEPVADFLAWVATPDGDVPVLLGVFSAIDPPFAAAEAAGGRFVALTETRALSAIERALLQRVYEHIMG